MNFLMGIAIVLAIIATVSTVIAIIKTNNNKKDK